MSRIKLYILIILISFAIIPAGANEVLKASVRQVNLSIEQAYELMINNNKSLQAAVENINETKYRKRAAIGHFFPKIGLNSTVTKLSDPIGMNILGRDMVLQDDAFGAFSAGAVWNIFTGGKILAANSAARANYIGSNEKLRETRDALTCELVKKYYGLRLAKDIIAARLEILETTQRHLDDAQKMEKYGMIAKSERLHAEVAYSKADRDYKAVLRDAYVTEDSLKSLIKADAVDLKDVEITPTSELFMYDDSFSTLDEYKQLATENSPTLKLMDVKKRLAQANYVSEAGNYSPTVSLFAYNIMGTKDVSHSVPRWAVGASVNFMVFDGLTRFNELKAADSARKQVALENQDIHNKVETLVSKQYQELLKYHEQYVSTNEAMESAKEALRVTTLSFKEGYATSLAVTDAQTALLGVKIERLNAIYNYDTALVELLKTHGSTEDIFKYIGNSTKESL